MSDALLTVTARYEDAAGEPQGGRVVMYPVQQAGNGASKRIVTQRRITTLLVDGDLSVDLVASDDADWLTSGPVLYWVEEWLADQTPVRKYVVALTGPGPVDLADVQPMDDPQTVAPYPVAGPRGEGLILLPYGDPLPDPPPPEPYAVLRYNPTP